MNTKLGKILTEISAGELIDKITILEIKQEKIQNHDKIKEVKKELLSLNDSLDQFIPDKEKIKDLIEELKNINQFLWNIEEDKRLAEKNKKFDETFIQLARNVYKYNDERAKIKLKINQALGSNIKEVKSYE